MIKHKNYVLLFLGLIFTGVFSEIPAQCDCVESASVRVKNADHVLVGTVQSVRRNALNRENQKWYQIKFQVTESLKGPILGAVRLIVPNRSENNFELGENWIVFTKSKLDRFLIVDRSCCSWTSQLDHSKNRGEYQKIVESVGSSKKDLKGKN